MKHLNLFESFSDINKICSWYSIKYYTINKDESVDANGDVNLSGFKLGRLPVNFNSASGYFSCYNNRLMSLEGSPNFVGGDFNCSYNSLTSLKGCPVYIGSNFECNNNQITTFEGFPKHVGGRFSCAYNPLYHIWILFADITKIELFNDMDIIQDGVVILDRLNFF